MPGVVDTRKPIGLGIIIALGNFIFTTIWAVLCWEVGTTKTCPLQSHWCDWQPIHVRYSHLSNTCTHSPVTIRYMYSILVQLDKLLQWKQWQMQMEKLWRLCCWWWLSLLLPQWELWKFSFMCLYWFRLYSREKGACQVPVDLILNVTCSFYWWHQNH